MPRYSPDEYDARCDAAEKARELAVDALRDDNETYKHIEWALEYIDANKKLTLDELRDLLEKESDELVQEELDLQYQEGLIAADPYKAYGLKRSDF